MTGCTACGAIAGGLRGQLDAGMLRTVLDQAGIADQGLAGAIDALERSARDVTVAGVAALEHDTVGRLIDVMA
jgi:hypothetical protein